jgi:glycosyltransferase involved in cell wall biosynthesis
MINVLHFITTIERGGAENHLQSLISAQIKNGYKIRVVYLKGKPYWKKYYESIGCDVYQYQSILNFLALVRNFKPSIVHAHLQVPEILTALVHLFHPKFKFIISKHNDAYSRFLPKILNPFIYRLIGCRAHEIICISKNVYNFCSNSLFLNKQKLKIVYYGIEPNIYDPKSIDAKEINSLKEEFKVLKHDFVFGTVARLHPQKSLDTLINAFLIFQKKFNNSKLLIVGEGHLEIKLKEQVRELGLLNNVIFTGKRDDIPQLYQLMDIFVLSSIYEGLGLVLLEAMCAKIPIIGTDAGAIPDIILKSGIIVPAKNINELSKAMIDIFKNDAKRNEMIQIGKTEIKERFTVDRMFNQTQDIYIKAINE